MRYDELSQRIKQYEAITTQIKLMPNLPIYARIDGRAFHTFCRGLQKPFCMELVETMQEVTKFLIEETNAILGYTQSDEISLCWLSYDKAPFNGKLFKLQSVLASLATSKFVNYIWEKCVDASYFDLKTYPTWDLLCDKCQKINPSFDCRVFQLPNEIELANCFIWRELDAVRNSVQMVAQANFSHKQLQGLSSNELQNKLLIEKNINFNDLPDHLKRGCYFKRELIEKPIPDYIWDKIPQHKLKDSRTFIRSQVVRYSLPKMNKVINKSEVYFHNQSPIYEQ